MSPELRRVLEAAFPGEAARYFSPMSIGDTPGVADAGAAAILAGAKTTTSSARWDYPDGRIPFAGALSVLLDGRGRARAIVETERVATMPFGAVDEAFARAYGEGDRTLAWWRAAMRAWYRASAARHGEDFSDDTPIICEWIAVARRLWPNADDAPRGRPPGTGAETGRRADARRGREAGRSTVARLLARAGPTASIPAAE